MNHLLKSKCKTYLLSSSLPEAKVYYYRELLRDIARLVYDTIALHSMLTDIEKVTLAIGLVIRQLISVYTVHSDSCYQYLFNCRRLLSFEGDVFSRKVQKNPSRLANLDLLCFKLSGIGLNSHLHISRVQSHFLLTWRW